MKNSNYLIKLVELISYFLIYQALIERFFY